MDLLEDPSRTLASSEFVRLEVLPQAYYHRNRAEVEIYESFFRRVSRWAEPVEVITRNAYDEALKTGLSALDALHVAAAALAGADELLTAEKPDKPIHRARLVPVRTTRTA